MCSLSSLQKGAASIDEESDEDEEDIDLDDDDFEGEPCFNSTWYFFPPPLFSFFNWDLTAPFVDGR